MKPKTAKEIKKKKKFKRVVEYGREEIIYRMENPFQVIFFPIGTFMLFLLSFFITIPLLILFFKDKKVYWIEDEN